MKQLPLFLVFAALVASGCDKGLPIVSEGERAQTMSAVKVEKNPFVGLWTSPESQSVNNWVVAFTPAGLVAVDGPGMKANGTYRANGGTARSSYDYRDGRVPTQDLDKQSVFELSPDGKTMTFSTGVALDPTVKLVRTGEWTSPSERQSSGPVSEPAPFSLVSRDLSL